MPEGPSLVILREQAPIFAGKRVVAVEGNSKIDQQRMVGQRTVGLRTWGKHFLVELRIHLLMFGRYCIKRALTARDGGTAGNARSDCRPDKPAQLLLRAVSDP